MKWITIIIYDLLCSFVALVVIEVIFTVQAMFQDRPDDEFEWDINHLATLTLILVLAVLILLLAMATADVMWASELYSECMAQLEGCIRAELAMRSVVYGTTTASSTRSGNSQDDDPKQLELLANLLNTFRYRVRTFPVRISAAWFHHTHTRMGNGDQSSCCNNSIGRCWYLNCPVVSEIPLYYYRANIYYQMRNLNVEKNSRFSLYSFTM